MSYIHKENNETRTAPRFIPHLSPSVSSRGTVKRFLYLAADAIANTAIAPFLRKYPVALDDPGVLRFDVSHADSLDTLRGLLNDAKLSYDICVLDEFPIFTYSRPDGDRTLCGFIRKREIQNVLDCDMSDADKLRRISRLVAMEKVESVGEIAKNSRKKQ